MAPDQGKFHGALPRDIASLDLWEVVGQQCYLTVGSRGLPVHARLEQDGVEIERCMDSEGEAVSLIGSPLSLERGRSQRCTDCLRAGFGGKSSASSHISGSSSLSQSTVFRFCHMLGARLDRQAQTVTLVHCPPREGRKGAARLRQDVVFFIGGQATLQDSLINVESWVEQVSERCLEVPSERRLLVLVNPAAGSGTAPRAWAGVEELWQSVPGLQCEIVVTTRAQEAAEYVRSVDLQSFHGIVIVSGDGLVHEVLNGLTARPDAENALKVPIGHIPAGSGNGLAKSVLAAAGESYGVFEAAFLIAKGRQSAMDLMSIQVPGRRSLVSFLSLSAGTISDIDIESERLRCIGGARFTVWGIWRVLSPLRLPYKLVYWPESAAVHPPSQEPTLDAELSGEHWKTIEDTFVFLWAMNMAWAAYDSCPAPGALPGDGMWHILVLRGARVSRMSVLKTLLGLECGSHLNIPGVELLKCRAFRLTPGSSIGHHSLDGELVPFGPIQVWPAPHKGQVLGISMP